MSQACKDALSNLNSTFLQFLGASLGAVILKGRGKIIEKLGFGAGWTAALNQLNAAQAHVDSACRGQGAGQYPYG